jgi:hypothetical protein
VALFTKGVKRVIESLYLKEVRIHEILENSDFFEKKENFNPIFGHPISFGVKSVTTEVVSLYTALRNVRVLTRQYRVASRIDSATKYSILSLIYLELEISTPNIDHIININDFFYGDNPEEDRLDLLQGTPTVDMEKIAREGWSQEDLSQLVEDRKIHVEVSFSEDTPQPMVYKVYLPEDVTIRHGDVSVKPGREPRAVIGVLRLSYRQEVQLLMTQKGLSYELWLKAIKMLYHPSIYDSTRRCGRWGAHPYMELRKLFALVNNRKRLWRKNLFDD